MGIDTSSAAVDRLACRMEIRGERNLLDGVIGPECATTLRDLAAENAALRKERDMAQSAANQLSDKRDAALVRVRVLEEALRKIAGISNAFTWSKGTRMIAAELQDILRAALAPTAEDKP